MDKPEVLFSGSRKRILKPAGESDSVWLGFQSNGKSVTMTQSDRAACVLSAYIFERLSDPLFWNEMPAWAAAYHYRSDWLSRRWDHLTFSHQLAEHGLPTHFESLVDAEGQPVSSAEAAASKGTVFLKVANAAAYQPKPVCLAEQNTYYYPAIAQHKLNIIPLQVKYYLKLTENEGPALRMKDNPAAARSLGLEKPPANLELERPVLEFYTSQEEPQRLLSVQEAFTLSGLTPGRFEELVETSYCSALGLCALFDRREMELREGTLEFAMDKEGLVLINTLSLNELRIDYKGVNLGDRPLSPHIAASLTNRVTGKNYFASPELDELLRESDSGV